MQNNNFVCVREKERDRENKERNEFDEEEN